MPNVRSSLGATTALLAAAIGFLGGIHAAASQEFIKPLDRPDPASITVPDLTFTPSPSDISDYDVHYYFYKAGVSYEQAFAEIDQCRTYSLATNLVAAPPRFIPLSSNAVKYGNDISYSSLYLQFGPLGSIFAEMLIAQAIEDNTRAMTNKCMAYKGYSRYGVTGDIWEKVNTGSDSEKFARMALIASGPKPAAEAIDP